MMWEPRTYRRRVATAGLVTFEVVRAETDLQVSAVRELRDEAASAVEALRSDLEAYIGRHPRFAESFVPVDVEVDAPEIVQAMASASRLAGTGPMAAVAGAIAERVALSLEPVSAEAIVENGGDVYVVGRQTRRVLLFAGDSPLSGRLAVVLDGEALPLAVCTSSGKVGHSVSLGSAHAATVIAEDGALADAVATAAANRVHGPKDVKRALEWAHAVPGVRGVAVILGDRFGAMGDVRLEQVSA